MKIALAPDGPLDVDATLARYHLWGEDPATLVGAGVYRLAKGDPALAELVEPLYGLRPTLAPTPLEMLVGSITAQQVNLSFAFACRARLVRRYGKPVALKGETIYAFPTA